MLPKVEFEGSSLKKRRRVGQPVGLSKTRENQSETETAYRINSNNHRNVSPDSGRPYFTAGSSQKLFLQPLGMTRYIVG